MELGELLPEGIESVGVALQPIFDLRAGSVVGWEALARFPDAPPGEMFHRARSVGLGPTLDLAMIERVIGFIPSLPDSLYLGINIDPSTIVDPRVGGTLARIYGRLNGFPFERLVLELTETVEADYLELWKPLRQLRQRGVRLAVDDVGAGHASLWHVGQLLPDIVKLDHRLVRGIDHSATHREMVAALISLGAGLRSEIVAEGVETAQELRWLMAMGIRYGQGFYLGEPRGVAEALGRVESGHAAGDVQSAHPDRGVGTASHAAAAGQ